jgi:hypothetical protein
MQDEPTPIELTRAVADFLRNEITPIIGPLDDKTNRFMKHNHTETPRTPRKDERRTGRRWSG